MSLNAQKFLDEKDLVDLPTPVVQPASKPKVTSFVRRLFQLAVIVIGSLFVLDLFRHGPRLPFSRKCHAVPRLHEYRLPMNDGGHQHPFPPVDNWTPYNGTTRFEIDPSQASGFAVKGIKAFGKVVFETSKLSNMVIIDLDVRTSQPGNDNKISVTEEDGHVSIDIAKAEDFDIYASAKITIPSSIISTFNIPSFSINLPRHMVDFSSLPESLEIGTFTVHVAQGFVRPGPVHTNMTQISIAQGALRGTLKQARYRTEIDVAHGNVTLDMSSICAGKGGVSAIHLGNGHLNGTLAVYNSTNVNVAKGGIWVTVDFKDGANERAELSAKIGSGDSRVYVSSIASNRLFEAHHISVAGDQLITYPSDFQGTIDVRDIAGDIKLAGEGVEVEKAIGGMIGKKGDSKRNSVSVKSVSGSLDVLVGKE